MNLKEAREFYYFYTGKTSEIVRQLALAGIAVIWLFRQSIDDRQLIHPDLVLPLQLIVAGLACDLVQYAVSAGSWGMYQRRKELQGVQDETEFKAPRQMNWVPLFPFVVKIVLVVWAYLELLSYLSSAVIAA